MKGLVIDEPWVSLITAGKKTWEMRSRNTLVRGRSADQERVEDHRWCGRSGWHAAQTVAGSASSERSRASGYARDWRGFQTQHCLDTRKCPATQRTGPVSPPLRRRDLGEPRS